ncbi:hypothetical protein CEUSTIGMA_g9282.t1 [Chlamydomonas eustigma]|uniref:Uncharacterized protein n=1 Tax=Chlamydomonas eustigma TaxID=1157962 RepID=A0A250XFJ6_9CHLO|nr:hypothetical protein CEUSTIGMA_g9282.t1 [Chlamydomonas eustigma]|eukprot:GAX81854.1 hypothetical protein CEUSTIGMA_g9282.t1 [Chlamydomonas eustigma]
MVLRPRDIEGPTAPIRSAAFGSQAYAHLRSSPEFTFGKASVESLACQFLGNEFSNHQPSLSCSPGPALYVGHASDIAARINRDCVDVRWATVKTGRAYPPLPTYSFRGTPSPQRYEYPSATLGRPLTSASERTAPRFTWSRSSSREASHNAYVSRDHERELYGKCSPGPGCVGREAFQSMGFQASSLKRSNPRFAAPKALRFIKFHVGKGNLSSSGADTSAWPGPGSYNW